MSRKLDEIIEPYAAKFILENAKFGALGIQDIHEAYHQGFADGLVYLTTNTIRQLGTCEKSNIYELKQIDRQWWLIHKNNGSKKPLAVFLFDFQQLSETEPEQLACSHNELIDTGTGYYFCPACIKKWSK